MLTAGRNLNAAFSPDGAHFLVTSIGQDGSQSISSATLFQGVERVRDVPGPVDGAMWLDDSTFLIVHRARSSDGSLVMGRDAHYDGAVIGTVGASALDASDFGDASPYGPLLSGGHGQLAYVDASSVDDMNDPSSWRYSIWSATATTESRAGVPFAWSPEGDRLLVWHYSSGHIPSLTGWIEVVEWPTGDTLFEDRDAQAVNFGGSFDPTGEFAAYLDSDGVQIVDVAAGSTTNAGQPLSRIGHTLAWDAMGSVVIPEQGGSVVTYDRAGDRVSEEVGAGDAVVGSPDGQVVVAYFQNDGPPGDLTVFSDGGVRHVPIPGLQLYAGPPVISPGGSAIFLAPEFADGSQALLLTP